METVNLGGNTRGDLAICSWGEGRTDVFGTGTDNALYHRWQETTGGPWGGWTRLPGKLYYGKPTAVSWGPGRLDIFIQSVDNECYHIWMENNIWNHENLGNYFFGSIIALSRGPGRLDVFARAQGGELFWRSYSNKTWTAGWDYIAPSGPSADAVSWGGDRIDLFFAHADGSVWTRAYDGKAWSAEESLDGSAVGGLTCVSGGKNLLTVVARGARNEVAVYFRRGGMTSGWLPCTTDSEWRRAAIVPSAVAWGEDHVTVAWITSENMLTAMVLRSPDWRSWTPPQWIGEGDRFHSSLVLHPRGGERSLAFTVDKDNAVIAREVQI